jgi:hypothetical protein
MLTPQLHEEIARQRQAELVRAARRRPLLNEVEGGHTGFTEAVGACLRALAARLPKIELKPRPKTDAAGATS